MATQPLVDWHRSIKAEVLLDPASLDFYAHDVFERGATPVAVVRPRDKHQLANAVAAATAAGYAVVPRGGGMSYTGGYTSSAPDVVVFDLAHMNRILDVNPADMTVTVEAGCTWADLRAALQPHGLRTPFWGTLSGLVATVGGGMSQNALFWGSGRHGTAAQSCLALEVVLADGTLLQTGPSFARPYGPDLTGLFLADTGALGIKASVTLRLVRECDAHAFASFAFEDCSAQLAALSEIERAGIATECFGFDPGLNAIRMKRDSLAADAKSLVNMMKEQGSVWGAIREGARVVAAGRDFLKDAKYSLHVLAEGRIAAAADADIAEAARIALANGGTVVENTIPKIIRSNPFGPLNSMLGPEGQRWAPVHGLLPHSKALACHEAVEATIGAMRAELEAQGMFTGTLVAAVGGAGVIVEPCIYWPDARNPLHEATVEQDHLGRLPKLADNPAARDVAHRLRKAIVDVFFEHGAAHLQIGRTYRYRESLDPAADALLEAMKRQVDPDRRMNPGSLGL